MRPRLLGGDGGDGADPVREIGLGHDADEPIPIDDRRPADAVRVHQLERPHGLPMGLDGQDRRHLLAEPQPERAGLVKAVSFGRRGFRAHAVGSGLAGPTRRCEDCPDDGR